MATVAALPACDPAVRAEAFVEPATSRKYLVFAREGHDFRLPSPALFVLHPYATDPSVLVRNYGLERRAAARRGWLVVVPEGTADAAGRLSWNASSACCGAGPARPDDLGYLRGVLADAGRRAAIDPRRVYALGESNGAFMAHRWACAASRELRAIVAIAGAAPGPEDPPCAPGRPVSVLHVHGDGDQMVQYGGGRTARGAYPSARESIELWRALDACDVLPRGSRETRLLFFAPLRVDSFSCPAGARVALWTVEGGGHQLRTLRLRADAMLEFLAASR
jgi:polyhydroxybutyrate depolymerase